jgi:hypothetical protein
MTTKHTPGPWVWAEDHPTNACANVRAKTEKGWDEDIATLYGSEDVPKPSEPGEPWGDHPIRRANARLIAAAPDLLEALNDALAVMTADTVGTIHMDDPDWYRQLWAAVDKARAAIAKAEGQQ